MAIVSSCLISRGLGCKTGHIHFRSPLSRKKWCWGAGISFIDGNGGKTSIVRFVCAQKGVSWSDPHFLVICVCSSDRRCQLAQPIPHHQHPSSTPIINTSHTPSSTPIINTHHQHPSSTPIINTHLNTINTHQHPSTPTINTHHQHPSTPINTHQHPSTPITHIPAGLGRRAGVVVPEIGVVTH